MASRNIYRETLLTLPLADEAAYLEHAISFVRTFVAPERRDRWLHLLVDRPKRAVRDSHKLRSALDGRRCEQSDEREIAGLAGLGIYHKFSEEPRLMTAAMAVELCVGREGLLFLQPGRLAVYFFHEFEIWLCRA